jgi:tetratricopeptide (TPR) repeat protein
MTEDHHIDLNDIEKQLDRIRELADKDEWAEARELLVQTRRHLEHLGVTSAYVLWLSAVAADKTEQLEDAVGFITSARDFDHFDPNYIRSERIVFDNVRKAMNDQAADGDARALRLYEILLAHGEADNTSHLSAARCHLTAGNLEAAGKLANALVLLSPACAEAWRLKATLARRAGNEELAGEMDACAVASGRSTIGQPAQRAGRAQA